MYLIFSEEGDRQTNEIMDRLLYYGKKVKRYNNRFTQNEKIDLQKILGSQKLSAGNSSNDSISNIAIYHRRPYYDIIGELLDGDLAENDIEYPKFQAPSTYFKCLKSNYLSHQKRFFEIVLNDPRYTICKIDYRVNKYDVLVKAKNVGMTIPPTLVSGNRNEVRDFLEMHNENIITKSLYNIIPLEGAVEEGFVIKCYTQKVQNISEMPEHFFPTLFQKNIEKKYELRIFYLDGKCYSAAILSQQDNNSQQDFRNAEIDSPNRVVPYNLSPELTAQVIELMRAVDLNTGSLDFMVGMDGVPYFLEINPVGQFGWINSYCNFGISDALAQKMIQFHG